MKKRIKIKLDKADHLKEYEDELQRWEGEGGNASELNDILTDLKPPVKPGEVFEVQEGNIINEGDDFYYEATIKSLSNVEKVD